MATNLQARPWMAKVLVLAGVYNIVWGMLAVFAPMQMLRWLGVSPLPTYPQFWQCIGMIVGVFGIGYLIAARDPYRHWPLTLVGLLGKILGPIGFVASIDSGSLPVEMGWTILTNDLAWWIPLAMILWGSVRFHQSVESAYQTPEADAPSAISDSTPAKGSTIWQTFNHIWWSFCGMPDARSAGNRSQTSQNRDRQ